MWRLTLLAVFLLASPSFASAQRLVARSSDDEKAVAAAEKKAYDLLEAIAGEVSNLHSATNRIRTESTVADLLWSRDEKRARELFKTVSKEIAAQLAGIDLSDQQAYQEISWTNQSRQEIVNRISQHDPELALSFLRESRLSLVEGSRLDWYAGNETNMEMQLAALIAARDPKRALELARASLNQGVTYGVTSVLTNVQQKDPKAAQAFYSEIVEQIKNEDLRDQNLMNAAWGLLSSFHPPQANEQTYGDLIARLTSATVAITPASQNSINLAQSLTFQINAAMPLLEKYGPGNASALKQWAKNIERSFDPATRMYLAMNGAKTADDVLGLIPQFPPELHQQLYQNAAWKAFWTGDVSRARQIASDFVPDPIRRRQMLDQFDEQLASRSSNDNPIAEAHRRLARVKSPERKVQVLIPLASNLISKGDKQGALDLLNEARGYLPSPPQNSAEMHAYVQLASSYAAVDLDQSFAIMQALVAKANELIAAAVVLDGFENRYLKEGEWMMPGPSTLANYINNLDQGCAYLAQRDFDRALALADQLERPELRLMAQLQIAQAVLASQARDLPINGRQFVVMEEGFVID